MKAYLIDPENKKVTTITLSSPSLENIYKTLGVQLIDVIYINDARDVIFIDDEGLYNQHHFFTIDGLVHPIAGKGLVLGTDSEGETIAPQTVTVRDIEQMVTFVSRAQAHNLIRTADRIAEEQIEARKGDGWHHIHISSADIIDSQEYTDDPPPEK